MNTSNLTFQILAVGAVVAVIFIQVLIWASRYRKVGPDEALIVSGRQIRTPDWKRTGSRIVTAGGTFVFPVIEKADTLSLAIFPVELTRIRARTSEANDVELDCSAQLKIKNEFESIAAAAQHFLHKSKSEISDIIAPVLEKSLSTAIATTAFKDLDRNPTATTAKMDNGATAPLSRMGLTIVSLKIQNLRSFQRRAALTQRLPGAKRMVVWIFVFSLLPCFAPIGAIWGFIWSSTHRDEIQALPSIYNALSKIGLVVATGQTLIMVVVTVIYSLVGHL